MKAKIILSVVVWTIACSQSTLALDVVFTPIDGTGLLRVTSVSDDGAVVAGYIEHFGIGIEAFRWTATEGVVGLGDFPGGEFDSRATRLSADGSVIVGYGEGANGTEAFRWTASEGLVGLGDLPGGDVRSRAFGVSADGSVIVGSSNTADGKEPFRWTAGEGMVGLGNLPNTSLGGATDASADGSVISGGSDFDAWRWTETEGMINLGHLPNGTGAHPVAISADGSVLAGNESISVPTRAFRWTAETGLVDLGELPGGSENNEPQDMSADGAVIVGWNAPSGAFMWDAANGMRSIDEVLTEAGVDLTGWDLTIATGVSADGRVIVGYGESDAFGGRFTGWRVEFIPEPASVILGVIAYASVGIFRWRQTLRQDS